MDLNQLQVDPVLLARAARCLSRRERAVLVVSASEGLALEAVAARLGLDPAEAERLLANALCKLDRALRRQQRRWWRFW
jgi:DNA-directed RNA polymerase specialized sigma24 family protein